jgi:flagellar hook assembly protein FlgD
LEDDFNQVQVSFTLEQNYPNPFNRSTERSRRSPPTTIRYQLPKATQVVLKIYNTIGQEVRALVNARQPAGANAVVWDGKDESGKEVSSGIYIYRLQAGESVQSRKLSFVR